jgi:nucleoside-diphosphate-sugar epimerase
MRVLLLGATGFLGRHVRVRFAGEDVTVVASGRTGVDLRLDLAAAGSARITSVLKAVAPDVVVNCAGVTDGDPSDLVAGNVVAVANLVAALDRYNRPVRLVHLGSAAEYGAAPAGVPVTEETPARPLAPYATTKLAGTALVLAARRHGRDATVLRVFSPIGPGTPIRLPPGRLVAEVLRASLTGEPATVGRLDGHSDFVDARDVASAVVAAAVAECPPPPVLNIGSGTATALRDLAALAAELAGVPAPREDGYGSQRSATVPWQQADITAITAALGWKPQFTLESSVRDMRDMGHAASSGSSASGPSGSGLPASAFSASADGP